MDEKRELDPGSNEGGSLGLGMELYDVEASTMMNVTLMVIIFQPSPKYTSRVMTPTR